MNYGPAVNSSYFGMMNLVKGQIVSSEPVSLSLVSSIFKGFLSSDNGTSAEVFACLKCTTTTVDEVIQAKTLDAKRDMERDQGTHHDILEKKTPMDKEGGSEGKKQLGVQGNVADAKKSNSSDKLGKGHRKEHFLQNQQNTDEDVGLGDLGNCHGKKNKKQMKNLESLDDMEWANGLERGFSKECKEEQVSEKKGGKKHKKQHEVHQSLDHGMSANELDKELRQKHQKHHKFYESTDQNIASNVHDEEVPRSKHPKHYKTQEHPYHNVASQEQKQLGKKHQKYHQVQDDSHQYVVLNDQEEDSRKRHKKHQHVQEGVQLKDAADEMTKEEKEKKKRRKERLEEVKVEGQVVELHMEKKRRKENREVQQW